MTPLDITVVVPTCGRPRSLLRLFTALARQTGVVFEVVVVCDGVSCGTAMDGVGADWPFAIRALATSGRGPSAARNTGARAATSPLLLFLDDDVEPSSGVLRAHVDCHASAPGRIAVGGLTPNAVQGGYIGGALAGWWERIVDELADPAHRTSFRDLLSGHCSMARTLFEALGGFDESLRCHEDYELGWRAMQQGVDICYLAAAEAWHHDASDLDKILARKRAEGIADVALAVMHPALVAALPLGRPLAPGRGAAEVHRVATEGGAMARRLMWDTLRGALRAFERAGMRDKWRTSLERSLDFWYWTGVREAAGGVEPVRHARRAAVPSGLDAPLELDLGGGLDEAERTLDRLRPHAVRLSLAGQLVADVAPIAGSEPLRGRHLRPLLLKGYPEAFARASADACLTPWWVGGVMASRRSSASNPAERATEAAPV